MKRNILFLILTIWGCSAYSQTIYLKLGTSLSKLGLTYIYQAGTEQQYDDPLLSYALSTGVEYLQHKYFSISSDLLLYKSGGKYSTDEMNTNFVFISPDKISVSYLSLGSSFNFDPINNKYKLQLSFGPRLDYIIGGVKNEPYNWIDKANGLNKLNYGFTAGAGLFYNLNEYVLGVEAQYLYRLRKLSELKGSFNQGATSTGGVDATEQVVLFGFSFGYRFKY